MDSDRFEELPPSDDEAGPSDPCKRTERLKTRANAAYSAGKVDEAIELYTQALAELPARRDDRKGKARAIEDDEEVEEEQQTTPDSPQVISLRSVVHANLSACYIKQSSWKEAAEHASLSLDDDSDYVKALQRRATANEKLDTWASLSTALADWQKLEAMPSSSLPASIRTAIKPSIARIQPRLEERKKAETDEMLGKLKGLGNSILGKFGLSTDNFGFTPNESGGYSMQFKR